MSAQIGSLNQNIAKAKIGQKKMCPPCIFVLSSKRACFRDRFRRKSFCPLHMFYQSPSTASSLKSKTYITPGLCRSKLIINCWNQYLLLVDQSFSLSHACVYIDTGVLRHLGWYAWNRTHTYIYVHISIYTDLSCWAKTLHLVGDFDPRKNISQIGSSFQLLGKIEKCSKPPTSHHHLSQWNSIFKQPPLLVWSTDKKRPN